MRLHLFVLAAFVLSIAAPAFAAGPFSDVPAGHWAYKAIEKAVEAGILQGYDGKFHGNKTLNRYQMAVVVARMLDRIETMGPGGKMGKKDIENLEALVIEFADELALLNVKVSTLEDAFAELKKDVDHLKKDYAHGGARAGISGLASGRLVMTDDDANAASGRAASAALIGGTNAPFVSSGVFTAGGAGVQTVVAPAITGGPALPAGSTVVVGAGPIVAGAFPAGSTAVSGTGVAGTLPISRYTGQTTTTGGRTDRQFADINQISLGFDRHYDEDFYLHIQLDFDAAQEDAFITGNNVQVNEAYVDLERWLFDGDVRVKTGTWALPFQRERNPEMVDYPNQLRYGFRTLDLTISPAFWDANWETVRVLGAGLWHGKDNGFQWNVAATSSTSPNVNRDGTSLAWRQAAAAGVNMGNRFRQGGAAALASGVGGTGTFTGGFAGAISPQLTRYNPALTFNAGQFGGTDIYGDALQSADNNASFGIQNEVGWYAWVGDKYEGGFRWDAGYFDNGGNLTPGAGEIGTASEWRGFQVNAGWWGWEDWGFMGSYYSADSDSATFGPGTAAAFNVPVGGAANFVGTGLYPLLFGANAYPDVESNSWSALVNYKFNDSNNVTVRYEDLEDSMGAAELSATVWTFAWNHRISSNSLLQLEYTMPESESTTVLPGIGGTAAAPVFTGGAGAAIANTNDVNDDLLMLNYKVKF